MTNPAQRMTVIPTMRYRDAPAAIDWLCRAFGFERHLVVPDAAGGIAHAQLRLGDGMIMLGSVRDDEYGRLVRQPAEAGGDTMSAYVVVADCDAHYARAKAAGAAIVMPIEDKEYGGRGYGCRDLEGRLWSFGSYDPWQDAAAP
ncbi:MAG TPA: VOC family protein [Candidatus Sulfotelmatobacter sp.]|nr:VOC family protein [Candidatus Sulfotelmatobacter sp.]